MACFKNPSLPKYSLFNIFQRVLLVGVFVFVALVNHLCAQPNFRSPVGGMLGKPDAVGQSPWSFLSNPSGLASVVASAVAVGYANDYQLKELSSRSILAVVPTKWMNLGGGMVQNGYEQFNYQQYSIVASRIMAPWLHLALRPNLIVRHQMGMDDLTLFTLDGGFQLMPNEQVMLGVYFVNPAYAQWEFPDASFEYSPSLVGAGVSYFPASNFEMELGLLKRNDEITKISFGLTSLLDSHVTLRGAVSSAPISLAVGAGLMWQGVVFDMGIHHHAFLGFSSAFGIVFSLPQKKINKEQ